MAEINITTTYNNDTVVQRVDVCDRQGALPMFSRMDTIMSTVIRLGDEGVRKALKALGWKAPGEESAELVQARLTAGDLGLQLAEKGAALQAAIQRAEEAEASCRLSFGQICTLQARVGTLEAEMRRYLPVIEGAECRPVLWHALTEGTGIATANGYRAALDARPTVGGIPVEVDPALPEGVVVVKKDGREAGRIVNIGEPAAWICPAPGCGHTITHAEHLVARMDNPCPSCHGPKLGDFAPAAF